MRRLVLRSIVLAVCLLAALYADRLMDAVAIAEASAGRDIGRAILHALVWLSGAFAAIAAIDLFFWDGVVARMVKRPVPGLLKSAFAAIVLVIAITGILGVVFGRDVTGIWATSGAIGIVLGFALRTMIQDIFTGIALNLDGSIKSGDWIELHHRDFAIQQYGRVIDITWRTSRIMLENNNIMVIPNNLMGIMPVANYAHGNHMTRLGIEIAIDFSVPVERVRRILLAGALAASGDGVFDDPPPTVVVRKLDECGVVYAVRFFARVGEHSPSTLTSRVMTSVLDQLHVAGISPAYPKEDVFHARLPQRIHHHEVVEDRREVLSRVDLFGRSLSADELSDLAGRIGASSYNRGAALVREGEEGHSMFIVVEGLLDVLITRPDQEKPVRVGRILAGEIFGEMSLLTGEPRSASVIAETDVTVYEIAREHIEPLLAARPGIAEKISDLVAHRRLGIGHAMNAADEEELEAESDRLKQQILAGMKTVFAVIFGPARKSARKGPA